MDLPQDAVARLSKSLTGDVVTREMPQYESLRRVWNYAADRTPAIITLCQNDYDVARSIEFAREYSLPIAVRGGGHSFAGYGVCDGGLVVNLSQMDSIELDAPAKRVRIGPGVVGRQLDQATQRFGLSTPLGSCPMVGVTGYALGGGEGSLTPKFGFGCDNIVSARAVTADGTIVRASAAENEDLFWALRGGGGNFGVVTELEFALHSVERVLSGHLKYSLADSSRLLAFLWDYLPSMPNDLYVTFSALCGSNEGNFDIAVMWSGPIDEGEAKLRPLREFIRPLEDQITPKSYLEEQQGGKDKPAAGDWANHRRSGHVTSLAEPLRAIVSYFIAAPAAPYCGISFIYWHGPWCELERDDAFGFRRPGYEYWIDAFWQRESDRESAYQWVEDFYRAMEPYSTGAVYVNGLEVEGPARVRAAYGDKYDRLRLVKRKYDPANVFHINQNIPPADCD